MAPVSPIIGSGSASSFVSLFLASQSHRPVANDVVGELLGTSQHRSGPIPPSDAIAEVVNECIAKASPIPVLVPSGPKKPPVGVGVDVAELSALMVLNDLNARVKTHHAPGISVRVRLEDATGWYLEDGVRGAAESMELYMGGFEGLVSALGLDFIAPVRESALAPNSTLGDASRTLAPIFYDYITESEGLTTEQAINLASKAAISEAGWRGDIPSEQRDFYRGTYARLFPDETPKQHDERMARYFAVTLARIQVGATCAEVWGNRAIQLNFAPPVPGIPKGLVARRLHYRTVPLRMSKRHLPFWRARGMVADGRFVLAGWGEPVETEPSVISIGGVPVAADLLKAA